MSVSFDVAVIGGGITGISAALAARARGAATCLLRAAPGATAMMNGAWNGPLPDALQSALAAAGYSLERARAPIVHQRGDVVTADYAGTTHLAAQPDAETIICGIAGLPHFNAQMLARLWNPAAPMTTRVLELAHTPSNGWAVASLAARLEHEPQLLLRALGNADAPRVILPAVLGVENPPALVEQLQDASGIVFAEALAVPPSLPGWRLQNALERLLVAHQITVLTGRAVIAQRSASRIEAIRIGDDTVSARSFVLATGKFVAGGITSTDGFQESVFDLPIWLHQLGDVYTAPDPLPLTDPVRSEPQPLLETGVHTDQLLRPVNRSNDVVYENVFAAGTIRAGWHVSGSGLGDCAMDGWNAGVNATA